jgi:hypothetical protein
MNPTVPVEAVPPFEIPPEAVPDLCKLVTQDDTPVDSYFAEKQQRLLTEPLYSSWAGPGEDRSFLVQANVGYFYAYREPPLVPDVLLSLDVEPAGDLRTKEGHSYYQWLMTKSPDVIIEIVSDTSGGEAGHKMRRYARQRVAYYVIFDPEDHLGEGVLRAFRNVSSRDYEALDPRWFPEVGLGLKLWEGTFEGKQLPWLRWCDRDGKVIPTGAERAERLAAQLRAAGLEPEA